MTAEGRLRRGKENYESGNKRLLNNSETQEYIATLPKEKPEENKEEDKPRGKSKPR